MGDKKIQPKKISISNTKQQMLSAYNELLKQLEEKRDAELKPEKKLRRRQGQMSLRLQIPCQQMVSLKELVI